MSSLCGRRHTNMADDYETTDVLICGCGPTGAMLSGYLAKYGISNIVLEREADITTDPRGIALDEDGIRLVQGLGLHRHLFTDIGCCRLPHVFPFAVTDFLLTLEKQG